MLRSIIVLLGVLVVFSPFSPAVAKQVCGERDKFTNKLENTLSIALLAAMSLLPLIEIAGRTILGQGIPGSIPLVEHLTLWIAFLGAARAARSDRLLALSTARSLPDRVVLS